MPHFNPAALAGLAVDVKPRLTKEQHDVLENEFRKQAKPNTNTKKRFAEVLGVSLDKVNVSGLQSSSLHSSH
jgi:flagellar hook-basal body complex protein FliE